MGIMERQVYTISPKKILRESRIGKLVSQNMFENPVECKEKQNNTKGCRRAVGKKRLLRGKRRNKYRILATVTCLGRTSGVGTGR